MRAASALLPLLANPAVAQHVSAPPTRSMPELSDLALAAMAAFGVWLLRRALHARFAKPQSKPGQD